MNELPTHDDWLRDLRDQVLEAKTDASAARSLYAGSKAHPPAALRDRVAFLRRAWEGAPKSGTELTQALLQHAADTVAQSIGLDPAEINKIMEEIAKGGSSPIEDKKARHIFLYHGFRHLESVTHYNPWSDATSRAGRVLSNLADAPFVLEGTQFASAESLLQSMRLSPRDRAPTRAQVGAMAAAEARVEGRKARSRNRAATHLHDPVWLWGEEEAGAVERRSPGFEAVMTRGLLARARAHPPIAEALSACGVLPVVHYLRRRGSYRLQESSHLRVCLPEVYSNLQSQNELPVLDKTEIGYWLAPTCADVNLNPSES